MLHGLELPRTEKLAIITVVYQNYEVLRDFLASFQKQTNNSFQLFIIDCSEDQKEIDLFKPPRLPPPEDEANSGQALSVFYLQNKGYAHGVNFGLKKAIEMGFEKFCVINCDTFVKDDFIQSVLVSTNQNPASLIGGKIHYAPGYEYHQERYLKTDLGRILWYAGGQIDWNHALIKHRGVDEIDKNQFNKFEETGFVTGCLMCFDKTVIDKIGFWDEKYFLYYEDADFCVKAHKKGLKLFYDPNIIIWHKNAQSTQGAGSTLHQKYQKQNRLRFAFKYAPIKTKLHLLINYFIKMSE